MAHRRRRKDDAAIARPVLPTYGQETSPPTYYNLVQETSKEHGTYGQETSKEHGRA
jgi:hypothetical protein